MLKWSGKLSKQLKDWHKQALELREKGWRSRPIAKELFGKETTKSTVNTFFKDYDNGLYGEKLTVNKPNILFFDIETSLCVSYHFGQWKQNLSMKQKVQESHLLSHSWAWGDGEIEGSVLTTQEALEHDDERLVLELWALFDNASVLVAHNGAKFDVRKVNAYFLKYGLPPPSPYKVIDTLKIAKRKFALPFNSLAYLAEFLGVTQKLDNSGIDLWIRCDRGEPEALQEILEYNLGDVDTLRQVYYKLQAWDNQGVNLGLYNDQHDFLCPHCASDDIESIEGKYAYTAQRKYSLYRCKSCKAVLRGNTKEGVGNKLVRVV